MELIQYGDGYLRDLHQRPQIREAQEWLNRTAQAQGLAERVWPVDGKFGNGSQAVLDAIRRSLGLDGARGLPLSIETLHTLRVLTGVAWPLSVNTSPDPEPDVLSGDGLGAFVTRAGWGASGYRNRQRLGRVRGLVIHHTAGSALPDTLAEGKAEVKAIQRMHQAKGWADVGYHLLLGQDGTWYQGRSWFGADDLDEAIKESAWALGSHTSRYNPGRIGLSVMGWFHAPKNHQMSAEAEASLRAMVFKLVAAYDLPASAIKSHRELGSTACPGDGLHPLVRSIRSEIAAAR